MRTRVIQGASIAAAALAMVSCSTSGATKTAPLPSAADGASTTVVARADPRLQQAVEAYSAAYLGDRPSVAYGLLSARCRSHLTWAQMVSLTHGAELLYGSAKLTAYHEDAVVGDSAQVTYSYDQPAINQSGQRWTREAGEWHWDEC